VGFWRLNWGRIVYFGVLIVAIVVGVIVGGGTGTTITAIAGAILALTLFAVGGGLGIGARERLDGRYGRPLDQDKRDPRD
jgi:hypothetical protein